MNQVALIANVPLDIDGRHYDAGDLLTVSSVKYGYLLVMGKARLSSTPLPPPPQGRRAQTRGPRGQYRRRDLRAED